MTKSMRIMLIVLAIIVVLLIGFQLAKNLLIKHFFANYQPPPISVSSTVAQKVDFEPRIPAVGNFVAIHGVEVNSQASGSVTHIHFTSGQYVAKDQPLIDIDDTVDQALLKFNQAELTLKGLNYKRQTDLFKRGATPATSVDEAKALLLEAEANTEKVQSEINFKHIKAPFAGLLGIRQVNLGQFIKPGDPIVTLQSLDPLYLEFYVPEQNFKRIYAGQNITFTVDEFPKVQFTGKITAINSKVDTNTHNIKVQATVPNCPAEALKNYQTSPYLKITQKPRENKITITCNTELNTKEKVRNFLLLPGMFASISISQPPLPDTIILPSTAISYSLYGNAVYIIEKDAKNNLIVRRQFIKTGEQRGNYTVITSGVKAGQMVVSSGELKLQNGARVVINNSVELKDIDNITSMGQ